MTIKMSVSDMLFISLQKNGAAVRSHRFSLEFGMDLPSIHRCSIADLGYGYFTSTLVEWPSMLTM